MPLCLCLPLPYGLFTCVAVFFLSLFVHYDVSFFCAFLSTILLELLLVFFLNLLVSETILAHQDVCWSCQSFVGCHAGALHITVGQTVLASASILWLRVSFASPACSHGSCNSCVELPFVSAWLISRPISLKNFGEVQNHLFQCFL